MLFSQSFISADMNSIVRFIYDLFGKPPAGIPVDVDRSTQRDRPFFRIQSGNLSSVRPDASGWDDAARPYQIIYSTRSFDDAVEKSDIISNIINNHGIPRYVFNGSWFVPSVNITAGGSLPAGSYTMTCSYMNPLGQESLPSRAFGITLAQQGGFEVVVPTWPYKNPLLGSVRVYLGQGSGSRKLAGSADVGFAAAPSVVVDSIPSGNVFEVSSSVNSAVRTGNLRCGHVSVLLSEDDGVDGNFDAVINVYLEGEVYRDTTLDHRAVREGEVSITADTGLSFTFDGFTV